MESKVNKSSLLCCRECWSKIQGFCNIHEEHDLLWRRGPLCSGGVKGKVWCNSWFLAKGEWLWSVGGRQNLLNKQKLEEVLSDELCQRSVVIWALCLWKTLSSPPQLLCACLACRNELSDAFVLPSAMPGVALATWREQAWPWRTRNKAGMLLLTPVCWHREGWLVTFGSDLSQMCK